MGERIVLDIKRDWVGKHCETSAIKTALDHHGLELSEEMLFGLGGGIGFIYWYMKMMPAPMVGGRNGKSEDFAGGICRRLGAEFSFAETAPQAWQQIQDWYLERGLSVFDGPEPDDGKDPAP